MGDKSDTMQAAAVNRGGIHMCAADRCFDLSAGACARPPSGKIAGSISEYFVTPPDNKLIPEGLRKTKQERQTEWGSLGTGEEVQVSCGSRKTNPQAGVPSWCTLISWGLHGSKCRRDCQGGKLKWEEQKQSKAMT